jgi:hypothetical protein
MTLVVKETLAGVLILSTATRRDQVRGVINSYLARPRVNVGPWTPAFLDENSGKYGVGFGLIVRVEWVNKADADAAWADATANLAILESGSFLDQYTSREDQDQQTNETIYHHRIHVPSRPEDF